MKISVIIPALNEAEGILSTLDSIKNQQGEFEIIVVDGGSVDGTAEMVQPPARVISSPQGRAVQMNEGARHSNSDVLLFLHADSRLPPNALLLMEALLDNPPINGGTFMLRFDNPQWLLRSIAYFTRFKFRYFHYGDQGIFVRRSIFEQLEGFREMPIMEDVDFMQRLHRRGRVTLIREPVTTSARRFLKHGVVRQQLLNIMLVICFLLGGKSETLSKWYRRTDCRPIGTPDGANHRPENGPFPIRK